MSNDYTKYTDYQVKLGKLNRDSEVLSASIISSIVNTCYVASSINEVPMAEDCTPGDLAVISGTIGENADAIMRTSYYCDGRKWQQIDGSLQVEDSYCNRNLSILGGIEIEAKGKPLNEVLSALANTVFGKTSKITINDDPTLVNLSVYELTYEEYNQLVVESAVVSNGLYVIEDDYIEGYGQQIKNVAGPTDLSDATPKWYVDKSIDSLGALSRKNTIDDSSLIDSSVIESSHIKDGSITKDNLSSSIQNSLDRADIAILSTGGQISGELSISGLVHASRLEIGDYVTANGNGACAEGSYTSAVEYSHAEGSGTSTSNKFEHAQGRYNISHKNSDVFGDVGNTLHSIGCGKGGTGIGNRQNAVEVMQDGKVFIKGIGNYDGTNPTGQENAAQDLATEINSLHRVWSDEPGLPSNRYVDGNRQLGYAAKTWTRSDTGAVYQYRGYNASTSTHSWYADSNTYLTYNKNTGEIKSNGYLIATVATGIDPWRTKFEPIVYEPSQVTFTYTNDDSFFIVGKFAFLTDIPDAMVNKTWQELITLKTNNQLVPGQQYRITDYVATTNGNSDSQSANHPFDLIVTADAVDKLNERAKAVRHEGDTYFPAATKFESWEVQYCLDNDTDRFAWALSADVVDAQTQTTGRGVIYRLVDEWKNEAPYDFKGIKMKAYPSNNTYYYTFGNNNDNSLSGLTNEVYQNTIKPYRNNSSKKLALNKIIINNTRCHENEFGYNCYGITVNQNSYRNRFDEYCFYIYVGTSCLDNVFKSYCNNLSVYGDNYRNTFEQNCSKISLGLTAYNNVFENACSNIQLGQHCTNNRFGLSCNNIVFGTNASSAKSWCSNINVEAGNAYIKLNPTASLDGIRVYQNVEIKSGVNNNSGTYVQIDDSNYNQNFHTTYQPADSRVYSVQPL